MALCLRLGAAGHREMVLKSRRAAREGSFISPFYRWGKRNSGCTRSPGKHQSWEQRQESTPNRSFSALHSAPALAPAGSREAASQACAMSEPGGAPPASPWRGVVWGLQDGGRGEGRPHTGPVGASVGIPAGLRRERRLLRGDPGRRRTPPPQESSVQGERRRRRAAGPRPS